MRQQQNIELQVKCTYFIDGVTNWGGARDTKGFDLFMTESTKLQRNEHILGVFSECVALQDPYCAWDKVQGKCRSKGPGKWGEESYFFQSVATGEHAACPPLKSKDAGYVGGLSSNQPKFNEQMPNKDQPDGQIINIIQEKPFENIGQFLISLEGFLLNPLELNISRSIRNSNRRSSESILSGNAHNGCSSRRGFRSGSRIYWRLLMRPKMP